MSCPNKEFQQCGGKEFKGETCCSSGTTCVIANDFYSQCLSPQSIAKGAVKAPNQQPQQQTQVKVQVTMTNTGQIVLVTTFTSSEIITKSRQATTTFESSVSSETTTNLAIPTSSPFEVGQSSTSIQSPLSPGSTTVIVIAGSIAGLVMLLAVTSFAVLNRREKRSEGRRGSRMDLLSPSSPKERNLSVITEGIQNRSISEEDSFSSISSVPIDTPNNLVAPAAGLSSGSDLPRHIDHKALYGGKEISVKAWNEIPSILFSTTISE
jgi:hypothetical protein